MVSLAEQQKQTASVLDEAYATALDRCRGHRELCASGGPRFLSQYLPEEVEFLLAEGVDQPSPELRTRLMAEIRPSERSGRLGAAKSLAELCSSDDGGRVIRDFTDHIANCYYRREVDQYIFDRLRAFEVVEANALLTAANRDRRLDREFPWASERTPFSRRSTLNHRDSLIAGGIHAAGSYRGDGMAPAEEREIEPLYARYVEHYLAGPQSVGLFRRLNFSRAGMFPNAPGEAPVARTLHDALSYAWVSVHEPQRFPMFGSDPTRVTTPRDTVVRVDVSAEVLGDLCATKHAAPAARALRIVAFDGVEGSDALTFPLVGTSMTGAPPGQRYRIDFCAALADADPNLLCISDDGDAAYLDGYEYDLASRERRPTHRRTEASHAETVRDLSGMVPPLGDLLGTGFCAHSGAEWEPSRSLVGVRYRVLSCSRCGRERLATAAPVGTWSEWARAGGHVLPAPTEQWAHLHHAEDTPAPSAFTSDPRPTVPSTAGFSAAIHRR